MDEVEVCYPRLYFNNKDFLGDVKSPYNKEFHSNLEAINFCVEMEPSKIFGHVSKVDDLLDDSNCYIFDLVPMIIQNFSDDPTVIFPALLSPTFGVSLFDVKPKTEGSNQKFYLMFKRINGVVESALREKRKIDFDVFSLIEKCHMFYTERLDFTYTSDLYRPCDLIFAVALMDVYHIFKNRVQCGLEFLKFTPKFVLLPSTPIDYVRKYSVLFNMKPTKNLSTYMSEEFYNKMKEDLKNFEFLNNFLMLQKMNKVVDWRDDCLGAYNDIVFDIVQMYTLHCSKIIESSPYIRNKADVLDVLYDCNNLVTKNDSAWMFDDFKQCIDCLVNQNVLDEFWPLLFKHEDTKIGEFHSILPQLVAK